MSVPEYALQAMFNQGQGGGSFGNGYQQGSIGNILAGIFGHPERPYKEASKELNRYAPQVQGYQLPFFQAGQQAIPNLQNWLSSMQNPSGFINNLMGQYQESPYAHYQQEQALRAAQNMGSANGLTGSTPLTQFVQQNARDISSQDLNQWLSNVLGINTQYGAGQVGLAGMGQNAANQLTNFLEQLMGAKAGLAYGQNYAKEQNRGGLFNGIAGLFGL